MFWSDQTDVVHPCSRYILVALIAFLLHFPLHFPLHFILDPDTPVGTRSIPRSDRSNVSDFPTFVSRVRSQGFKGRSRFDSCLETELGVRFPIPTGFGCEVGRGGSKVKPGLDPTGIHYCSRGIDLHIKKSYNSYSKSSSRNSIPV